MTNIITVFPLSSYEDIDNQIIARTKTKCLGPLSVVNKFTHLKLNNAFFQERFFTEHPCLKKFQDKNLFKSLKKFYPNYCWKTINYFWNLVGRRKKIHHRLIAAKESMPPSAINEALIAITKPLIEEKKQHECTIKDICGYGYEDPNSPIHKAYKEYDSVKLKTSASLPQLQREIDALAELDLEVTAMLNAISDPESFDNFSSTTTCIGHETSTIFEIKIRDEEIIILKINNETLDPNENLVTFINLLIQAQDEMKEIADNKDGEKSDLINHVSYLWGKYIELDKKRISCVSRIQDINTLFQITEISKQLTSNKMWKHFERERNHNEIRVLDAEYYKPVWLECINTVQVEKMAKLEFILQECSDLIQMIVREKREATKEELKSIEGLINACKDYKIKSFDLDDKMRVNQKIWKAHSYNTEGQWFESLPQLGNGVRLYLLIAQKQIADLNGAVSTTSPGPQKQG